jgi:hypothetical protein
LGNMTPNQQARRYSMIQTMERNEGRIQWRRCC